MAETQVEEKAHVQELLPVIEYGHGVWHRWQAEAVMGSSSGFVSLQWLVCTGTHVPRGCPESSACAGSVSTTCCPTPKGVSPAGLSWLSSYSVIDTETKVYKPEVLSRAKYSKNNSWLLKDSYSNSV